MATKEKPNKAQKYIVIARSTETMKERFAWTNGRKVLFDTPTFLSDAQVNTLRHQKEGIQMDKRVTVSDIMEKHSVDQNKANQMLKLIQQNPEQGGKKLSFVAKYIVTPV